MVRLGRQLARSGESVEPLVVQLLGPFLDLRAALAELFHVAGDTLDLPPEKIRDILMISDGDDDAEAEEPETRGWDEYVDIADRAEGIEQRAELN